MFTVKFEYGIGNAGSTESCVTFESYEEAREFAHEALDEILRTVQDGVKADNAILRVWDDESDRDLINDIWSLEL